MYNLNGTLHFEIFNNLFSLNIVILFCTKLRFALLKDVRGHFWRNFEVTPVRHTHPHPPFLHESGYRSVFPDKLNPVFCFLLISGKILRETVSLVHIDPASHTRADHPWSSQDIWHLPDTWLCLPDMCEPLCPESDSLDDDTKRIQDVIHRFLRPRPRNVHIMTSESNKMKLIFLFTGGTPRFPLFSEFWSWFWSYSGWLFSGKNISR